MPMYFLQGGTVIWPLLLSSVATRAILSLAAAYGPAVGEYPEGHIEADLEAVMCVIVNLVNEKRLSGPGLSISKWKKREAKIPDDETMPILKPINGAPHGPDVSLAGSGPWSGGDGATGGNGGSLPV